MASPGCQQGKLAPGPRCDQRTRQFLQPAAFAQLKQTLYKKDWVVYAKAPFKRPAALFRYLGQYTHRVAISNHRCSTSTTRRLSFAPAAATPAGSLRLSSCAAFSSTSCPAAS